VRDVAVLGVSAVSPALPEIIIDTTLLSILAATALAGVGSILAAALLSLTVMSQLVKRMVSFSVGVLLATALLHSLPEAFESGADTHALFATLLAGLLGFFLLEKLALLRHSHHHEGDGHGHHHGHDREAAGKSGMLILVGDTLHNFADGILIAAAFIADPHIGVVTALAIAAHEIPQEVGDFIVLLNAGFSRARAFAYNLLSSLAAIVGGVIGYLLFDRMATWVPFVLVLASSSFIYIAVSDLMPQMQRRPNWRESAIQLMLVILGVALVYQLTHHAHGH
jgi:zinc and cadmium transporter